MNETEISPEKSLRVLVVEDDNTVADLVLASLESLGHEASRTDNAEDALRLIASKEPHDEFDLIYLDIQLPNLDGIEFCQMCRTYNHPKRENQLLAPDIYIVALTSLNEPKYVMEMLSSGANDYLNKPVSPTTITVKTTVCRYAIARNRRLHNRIKAIEAELLRMQRIQMGLEESRPRNQASLQTRGDAIFKEKQ